jgi:hypothetical protein
LDVSDIGGFGSRQTQIAPSLGSFIGTRPQATKASCFTTVRKLEGYLQVKDEGEVEGLVDRMGVMGIGGESGFVGGGGGGEVGVAVGRPKVEFGVAEGPAREGDPASWIHLANSGALCCGVIHGGAKFCIAPAGGCTFQSHQKKADVKDNSVYLTAGTLGRGKAAGFTGWFTWEAVFGNWWGELEQFIDLWQDQRLIIV